MRRKKILYGVMFLLVCLMALQNKTTCQAKEGKNKNYRYKVENGKVVILEYIGKKRNVTVPKKIAGKPVYKLGWACFSKKKVTCYEVTFVKCKLQKSPQTFPFIKF